MSDEHITLGIETSCDETGIGIFSNKRGLLAHKLFSQVDIHAEYGGVVPELASRDHIRKIVPLIKECLSDINLNLKNISCIGYTSGPGLAGALLVGGAVAQSLSWSLSIPSIAIHHMEGHLLSPLLDKKNKPEFPFIALLVSGGHTLLVDVERIGQYKILGESLDDAVGEAFDKTAKILGLGYPGGPALSKLAKEGNPDTFRFPRPMIDKPSLDFSFSGLKTFAKNTFHTNTDNKADIAKAFEMAAVDILKAKCLKALLENNRETLVVSGGVSANDSLRNELDIMGLNEGINVFYPEQEFCTDNGAMIALVASIKSNKFYVSNNLEISIKPRWSLEDLKIAKEKSILS